LGEMVIVIASAIGLMSALVSLMGYRKLVGGEDFVCRPGTEEAGCSTLYLLPQAWLFGKWHFSVLAPPYFALMFISAILVLTYQTSIAYLVLMLTSTIGILLIPYLVYIEIKIAKSICMWCTIMHSVIIIIWLLSLKSLL